MHDIFISYAKEDKLIAQTIAEALKKENFNVWWDAEIPTGSTFDSVIEQAVADAKCVIVLWSENSIKSEWVHIEAAEGKARDILIPILISDADIPFAFRRRQTADLRAWLKDKNHPSFERVLSDIRSISSPSDKNSTADHEFIQPEEYQPIPEQPLKTVQPNESARKNHYPKYLRITGIIILVAVVVYFISSIFSGKTHNSNLKIGDKYAGGIVFQIDQDGNSIKICSDGDLGSFKWNDAKIKCQEYTVGEYTDWYLPSKSELNMLYKNLLRTESIKFKDDWYWSSTETDGKAWEQDFANGVQQNNGGGNDSYSSVFAIMTLKINELKIGDTYAGGIIFQIDSDGLRGKVCSKVDLGSFNWNDAKVACQSFSEGDYSDWYLPSKDELNLLYNTLSQKDLGNFSNDWYWSSSETDGKAWEQHFEAGIWQNDGGGNQSFSSVRAIRNF